MASPLAASSSPTNGFQWRANIDQENARARKHDPAVGQFFTTQQTNGRQVLVPVTFGDSTVATSSFSNSNNIAPGPGDDTSPPNAVSNANQQINGICLPVTTSGGWSHHAPRSAVYPSHYEYAVSLYPEDNDALHLQMTLEYTNPYYAQNETMMVHVAIAKTLLHGTAEEGQQLQLVSTKFQELCANEWIDITADIDYTGTANEVVDAVLADANSGQTAGKAMSTETATRVTLGPFSHKARLVLTYKAERASTYPAMSVSQDGKDIGTHRLLPLWVALPFATPGNNEAGVASISVTLNVISTKNNEAQPQILPLEPFQQAYRHLKCQMECLKSTTMIVIPELVPQQSQPNDHEQSLGYTFAMEALPPRSCGLLSWLVLPNPKSITDDFVLVEQELQQLSLRDKNPQQLNNNRIRATIQLPSPNDVPNLRVPLPGHGPVGQLFRLKVSLPRTTQPRAKPMFILNLTLTDKSGSTGRMDTSATTTTTMRQRFNELAVARCLKRFESIPALIQAGVLLREDVWMEVVVPFDHEAPASSILQMTFRVGDVVDSVAAAVAAVRASTTTSTNNLNLLQQNTYNHHQNGNTPTSMIQKHIDAIRSIQPGGATDFSAAPITLMSLYPKWEKEVQSLLPSSSSSSGKCTFVEFDTDGGHNRGGGFGGLYGGMDNYVQALETLCGVCNVRSGVVTGFGDWLNQGHATRVAEILGGSVPPQLALSVPEPGTEGLDLIFRRGFAAWINALRQAPLSTLKISAGSVEYATSSTTKRTSNAMEVLAIQRATSSSSRGQTKQLALPNFGSPDVSNEKYTKTVLQHVEAEEQLIVYIVSRLESADQLASALQIESSSEEYISNNAQISTEAESSKSDFLAYDWLSMLSSGSYFSSMDHRHFGLAPLLQQTILRSRLEEEVSFRFNIPSPSGVTSYLGRCKTIADRAAIDKDHRPFPPMPPLVRPPRCMFGAAPASGGWLSKHAPAGNRGLFGGFGSSPAPVTRTCIFGGASSGLAFGSAPASGGFGAPASGGFGAPSPAPGGFGAGSAFGAPAPAQAFGEAPAPSGGLFGAPAPSGSLFGAPAPSAFGLATPTPSRSLFGSAPAPAFGAAHSGSLFGTPAPAFGAPSPAAAGFSFGPHNVMHEQPGDNEDPQWSYAMRIPTGSDQHPSPEQQLKDILANVGLACQVMVGDPSITFFCDICRQNIPEGHSRYHCFDCDGFDMCSNCKDGHRLPLHRVRLVTAAMESNTGTNLANPEDPLVSSLLRPPASPSNQMATGTSLPLHDDRWVIASTLKVQHFMFTVLHWWPLFRTMCPSCDRLPKELPDELIAKLTAVTSGAERSSRLMEVTKVIIDSITREENQISADAAL